MSIINYDLDEEYKNALDKEAEKESRLFSISLLDFTHPLDILVLDDEEDLDIRIAALDCLDLFKYTIYDIDIYKVPKELALAVIERLDSETKLKEIVLNHPDPDYQLKALENKYLKDEDLLKYVIENKMDSRLRSAAAKHPNLNDSTFLENLALNDEDKYVRQAAVSNYSTRDISTLKEIIRDDEDIVRISALENLVFKYNLFYPSSNKKYTFKKKFNKISEAIIKFYEDSVPKNMNDEEIADLMDFDLLKNIYINSIYEDYEEIRENLIEYLESNLFYFEKYNPFDDKDEDESFKKKLYDDLKIVFGDERSLFLYQIAYDNRRGNLKYYLDDLKDLEIDFEDSDSYSEYSPSDKPIDENYFINLAYNDSNEEIVRLALEAISDNSVLLDFIDDEKPLAIRKTAIKRLTDMPSLVGLAINHIDKDIQEAQFFNLDWICKYVIKYENYFASIGFNIFDFYENDFIFYERSFDNRLNSSFYNEIAEFYYKDSFSYCLFKKIKNYFDLIYILKNTHSYALRDLIIYNINNPIILADLALNAIDERIRYTAFGRINSKSILKFIYSRTDDFRIKLLYISNIDDSDILEYAFLNEENDVLRRTALENSSFEISPQIIEHCIDERSYISSLVEKKFAKHFVNYRSINKKQ